MRVERILDRSTWSIGLLGFVIAGCSAGVDRPETAPVSGTVVYKGQPVEGATVSFMADGAPRAASGVTDADGKFQLSTFELNDGALIGEHVVTISKQEAGATAPQSTDPTAALNDPSALVEMQLSTTSQKGGPKSLLPQKYANPNTSPLKEKVTAEGPNSFVFTLTD